MFGHAFSWAPFAPAPEWPVISGWVQQFIGVFAPGHLGVVLFFLLSGFVIGRAYPVGKNFSPIVYFAKRWIRIWPLFAVSVLIGCLAVPSFSVGTIAEALLLVRDYIPQNPVIWSVSYEFWFYAALPLIFVCPACRRVPVAAAAAALCFGVSVVGFTVFRGGVPVVGPWIVGLSIWLLGLLVAWFAELPVLDVAPHRKILSLLLLLIALRGVSIGLLGVSSALRLGWGVCAGRIFLVDYVCLPLSLATFAALLGFRCNRFWRTAWWGSLLLIVLLELGVLMRGNWLSSGNWIASLLIAMMAVWLWYFPEFCSGKSVGRAILVLAPVGGISYGIYLFHYPLMALVGRLPRILPGYVVIEWSLRLILSVLATVLISCFFELRIQPILRRRFLGLLAIDR